MVHVSLGWESVLVLRRLKQDTKKASHLDHQIYSTSNETKLRKKATDTQKRKVTQKPNLSKESATEAEVKVKETTFRSGCVCVASLDENQPMGAYCVQRHLAAPPPGARRRDARSAPWDATHDASSAKEMNTRKTFLPTTHTGMFTEGSKAKLEQGTRTERTSPKAEVDPVQAVAAQPQASFILFADRSREKGPGTVS